MIRASTGRWSVAPTGDRFLRDGKDSFLLSDTVWAGFSSPTDREWDDYLERRRSQGFDAVMVSMLPIPHDRSGTSESDIFPFVDVDGRPDIGQLNSKYFERVTQRVARSTEAGLSIIPVLLWNTFLPGTWGERVTPGFVMSPAQRARYVDVALAALLPHAQVILVSGDDNLDSPAAIAAYVEVATTVREAAPMSLIGMHTGPTARFDADIANAGWDFWAYQSGHFPDWRSMPLELTAHHLAHDVRRPVLNLEPPYENHSRVEGEGRHTAADVRGASWASVLAGAAAGLGYGAHGVWSWHREGREFSGEAFSGLPEAFEVGLQYRGADDVGFLKQLVERHTLYPLREHSALIQSAPRDTVAAATPDGRLLAVYVPHPGKVELTVSVDGFTATSYDLDRRIQVPASSRGMNLEAIGAATDSIHILVRE